jgi:hypothetical protein
MSQLIPEEFKLLMEVLEHSLCIQLQDLREVSWWADDFLATWLKDYNAEGPRGWRCQSPLSRLVRLLLESRRDFECIRYGWNYKSDDLKVGEHKGGRWSWLPEGRRDVWCFGIFNGCFLGKGCWVITMIWCLSIHSEKLKKSGVTRLRTCERNIYNLTPVGL